MTSWETWTHASRTHHELHLPPQLLQLRHGPEPPIGALFVSVALKPELSQPLELDLWIIKTKTVVPTPL